VDFLLHTKVLCCLPGIPQVLTHLANEIQSLGGCPTRIRWRSRKVEGHSKSAGSHKTGNDWADELAVAAKKEAEVTAAVDAAFPQEREALRLAREATRQ
jgi:hypothetical protein